MGKTLGRELARHKEIATSQVLGKSKDLSCVWVEVRAKQEKIILQARWQNPSDLPGWGETGLELQKPTGPGPICCANRYIRRLVYLSMIDTSPDVYRMKSAH